MNILNLEPLNYSQKAKDILVSLGNLKDYNYENKNLKSLLEYAEVIITRLNYNINSDFIDKCFRLKYILTATTGLDHIDLKYTKIKGIKVVSLKGETKFLNNIYATSEHTWALLLSLVRNINPASKSIINNHWNRDLFRGTELFNKNIGILGFGRIGKKIARYAKAFGMNISFYDPHVIKYPKYVTKINELNVFLNKSNILSIHIPYNKETHNFISEEELSRLPKSALIINTSRGGIIDEDALVHYLRNDHISGCALDVIKNELNNKLMIQSGLYEYNLKNDNCIITPHIGGATYESMHITENFIANKFKKFLIKKDY